MSLYELFSEWFTYDLNGNVYWKKSPRARTPEGTNAGTIAEGGYIRTQLKGVRYGNHLIIYTLHYGEVPDGKVVDHKDGVTSNNRPDNLRLASNNQNMWNSRGKNLHKGVNLYRNGKYRASIGYFGKVIHLGYFDTAEEAKEVYNEAALKYYGEFARLG